VSTDGRTEEMKGEDRHWKVAYLHFDVDATVEDENSALAKRPGWEPWARETHSDGGTVLWLKRPA
jgi:hypothetical protein